MSDDTRALLRRGAGAPSPSWGFDTVWRRSHRRRTRNIALKSAAAVGVVSLGAVGAPLIRSNVVADDRGAGVTPAGERTWRPSATWQRIPGAPIQGRYGNVAVWTGQEALIWGGTPDGPDDSSALADGAAFDPGARSWRGIADGPLESAGGRTAVWAGDVMLVWGGAAGDGSHDRPDNGAAYDPGTDSWTGLPASPYWSLASHSAIWTGDEMVVWGGVGAHGVEDRGAAFDPERNAWRTIAPGPLEGRDGHTAIWTGEEMLVWGGRGDDGPLATGASYSPDSDSWRALPSAPVAARDLHAATWTGEEMIVWGGWMEEAAVSDGAAYDPVSDTWRELAGAPIEAAILSSSAVWTGRDVIVTGAKGKVAAYSPEQDEWAMLSKPPMGTVTLPTLLGTGGEVILWGGVGSSGDAPSNGGALLHLMH